MLIHWWNTRVQIYPTSARKVFGVVKERRVPAEKCSYRSIKRVICLKQKHWSKRWVLGTSNRCHDHLSRQFLTTASTIPYSSKNSSAEHIHDVLTCLILTNTLNHIDKKNTHWLIHTHTHTLTNTETCTKSVNMFGWGIFGAVWKGTGCGQELSAKVIMAPVRGI